MSGILTLPYFALAALLRALPNFRGKWHIVRGFHRALLPLLPEAATSVSLRLAGGGRVRLDLRDLSEATHFWMGQHEEHIARVLRRALRPDFVVINAGANIGLWTVELGREVQQGGGVVYAIEPVPENLERLRANVRENGLDRSVLIRDVALGRSEGTVSMWLRSRVTGATSGTAAVVEDGDGHIQVPRTTLDALLPGLARCDLLMIDVDGSEFEVLAGAPDIVRRLRPAIIGEWDAYWLSRHKQLRADVVAWARANAYALHAIRKNGNAEPVAGTLASEGDLLLLPDEWTQERRGAWIGRS
jgi:FkbM family methyltransferase